MPTIEFGSLDAARDVRSRIGQFLKASDKGNEKTVRIESNIPDSILERVKESAFESREERVTGAGKAQLSQAEQDSLKKTTGFNWQDHGFEAMAVKAAMQQEGVDTWIDYYEPGEGVQSARSKLREGKQRGMQTRASAGIEGMRTDQEDIGNMGRRAQQAERASAERLQSAKAPAIVEQDADAIGFLREEQQLGNNPFDVSADLEGRNMSASGRDVELVEERNQQRSEHARLMDDLKTAEVTTNPVTWSQNPAEYDFPGVDTLEPEKVHERRSEQAQAKDNNELAPLADDREQWASAPDQYDWPGVDTPNQDANTINTQFNQEMGNGLDNPIGDVDAPMLDDRAMQDTLGFAADATEARDSQLEGERNTGGIMEDTRDSVDRGVETNDMDAGEQAGLDDAMRIGKEADRAMKDMDKDMRDLTGF